MASASGETSDIRVATHNTSWPLMWPGCCNIQAIDGIYNEDGSTSPSPIRQYAELEYVDRAITVPSLWPSRLSSFIDSVMKMDRDYNCHMFAKWMLGITKSDDDMAALVEDPAQFEPRTALKPGELGAIVVDYPYTPHKVFHSLLGLEEETGLTLQVMEPLGDLAIALAGDVVNYYELTYANSGLYAVPERLWTPETGTP